LVIALVIVLPACQQKMAVQPSIRPDEETSQFTDGRGNRPMPAGTVARGHLRTDRHLYAGKRPAGPQDLARSLAVIGADGMGLVPALAIGMEEERDAETFPFKVTREVIEHGRNRFNIYCVVCHDPLGTGQGKIVERGYTRPPSFHIERLRSAPVGHFFNVITNGYGSMPDYKQQIPPDDRWAIIAYIRALQLSQHFPKSELTEAMRREWREQGGEGPP
jgi:mono/diheme cytochrome c family protein